ncbi:hypothetical protein Hte_012613 [Hypoxylon texense]
MNADLFDFNNHAYRRFVETLKVSNWEVGFIGSQRYLVAWKDGNLAREVEVVKEARKWRLIKKMAF